MATIDSIIAASGIALFATRYELPLAAVAGIAGTSLVAVWLALFALHFRMFRHSVEEEVSRFPVSGWAGSHCCRRELGIKETTMN